MYASMNLVIFHSFILTILNGLEFVDGSPLDSWKCYLSVDNIIWFVVKIATNTPTHRESTSTFLSRALFLCSQFNQSSFTPWLDHKLKWPIWMGKVLNSRKNKSRNSLVCTDFLLIRSDIQSRFELTLFIESDWKM